MPPQQTVDDVLKLAGAAPQAQTADDVLKLAQTPPGQQTAADVLKLAETKPEPKGREAFGFNKKSPLWLRAVLGFSPNTALESVATFSEQLYGAGQGGMSTRAAIGKAQPEYEKASSLGQIKQIFERIVPFGKKPTTGDLDNLANKNEWFGEKWKAAKESQRIAKEIEREAHGDGEKDWDKIQQRYADAVVAKAKADGTFEEDVAPTHGRAWVSGGGESFHEPEVLTPGKVGTRQKALEAARNGTPGLTRPAPTDDELLKAGLGEISAEVMKQRDEKLPGPAQAVLRGAAEGVKMVGPMKAAGAAAKAMGASEAISAAAGGAALSALNQGLSIGYGNQDSFSIAQMAQEAALMGIGDKVGRLAGIRFPKKAGLVQTIGQLGTMEAGNALLAPSGGPPSEHPMKDRFERAIETVAMLGTAHAMNAVGKPSAARLGDIARAGEANDAAAAQNKAATDEAGTGLHDNIRSALDKVASGVSGGRLGVAPRNTVKADIQAEVTDQTLDFGIDLDRRLSDWQRWRTAAAGNDPAKGLAIDETVRRMVENGGQMPPESVGDKPAKAVAAHGLTPEQLQAGYEKARAAGEAMLPAGKILADLGTMPEGRYRHGPLLEVDPGLSKVRNEDVIAGFKAGIEAKGDISKIANEIEARVSEADNPAELAAEFNALAQKSPAGGKTAYGTSALEDAVQVATERGIEFAGKHYRRPGTPKPSRNDLKISKAEFDAGKLKDGTPVSREDAAAGKYGSLVGGYKFHEGRGFWLPLKGVDPDITTDQPGSDYKGPRKPKLSVKAPFAGGVWNYMRLRETGVEQAILDPKRLLDFSPEASAAAGRTEIEAARRGLTLEGYKKRGWLLYDHQLPKPEDAPAMRQRERNGAAELDAMKRAFAEKPSREGKRAIDEKLLEMRKLREEIDGTRFRQIPDDPKKWGQYAGMWMDRAAWDDLKQLSQTRGAFEKVFDAIHGAAKAAKFTSGGQVAQQIIGNVLHTSLNGVYLADHPAEVKLALHEQRKSSMDDPNRSQFGREFDSMTRGHNLGGSSDIASQEVEAKTSGFLKKTKGALSSIGKAVAYIDRGTARSVYYIERAGGASPSQAMAKVTDIFDYGTLPGWVRPAAKYFSFMRWPTKVAQTAGNVMKSRPRILGEPIPTPMDSVIEGGNGGGKAQAALVARGIANLTLHASKVLLPLHAYQALKKEELGITTKQLDAFIESDDSFQRLPAWMRKAVKYTWIPTGKTPLGRIEGHNFLALHPAMQALSFFSAGLNGRGFGDVLWQYGQKSVLGGPGLQAARSRNFSGKNTGSATGGKPGEQYWALENLFTPTVIQQPVEAYFNEMGVPPEERDALRQVMRTFGDPVQALKPPPSMDAALATISKFKDQGVVIMETPAEGGEYPKVAREYVGTPKGIQAQFWLDQFAKSPQSYYGYMMKLWRGQQGLNERAENMTK